jgi:hypothetical protein
MPAITITLGDAAENHHGMQMIGKRAQEGFSVIELMEAKIKFENKGYNCEMVDLLAQSELVMDLEEACVLVIRKGAQIAGDMGDLYREQQGLEWDSKAFMYGRVVNKRARYNLCFDDEEQEPNYEAGKGRIVKYSDVPLTAMIRQQLPEYFGPKTGDLKAEGNYYYDLRKTGIGFHGDAERRIVVAVRLGDPFPLHFQWFHKSKPIGKRVEVPLASGDMYAMSSKAVGTDWRCPSIPTLRHAAGCKKFTTI